MRFCQAFMTELYQHIGETKDVPAGDIGVGAREIGYLFGMYKKITRQFEGVLTGKNINWGGSNTRKEATGYGSVYFAENILNKYNDSLEGKRCCVSGSGNVAIYTIEKLYDMGAIPVTCSDSKGTIYHERGIDPNSLKAIKEINQQSLEAYAQVHPDAVYTSIAHYPEGRHMVWDVPCDIAFPSATQNELNLEDAKKLVANGCKLINEGANMPCTSDAVKYLKSHGVWFGPGKAANAGGVATSQLEMSQNASMSHWSFEEVDIKLRQIMNDIFETAYQTSIDFDREGDLVTGANIAGFRKVADSMIDQGSV
jgi:glutamate dehydrogenase (NADP+)